MRPRIVQTQIVMTLGLSPQSGFYHFIYLLFSVNMKPPRHRFGLSLGLGLAIIIKKARGFQVPWLIFDSHLKGGSKMPLDMPQEGSIMCLYLIYSKMLIKHQLDILKGQQKHRSNVHLRRWGSSLQGLHTLDPPLSPPATPTDVSGKGRGTNMGVS